MTVDQSVTDSPKMIRETLCVAQTAVGLLPEDYQAGRTRDAHIAQLQRLIDATEDVHPADRAGEAQDGRTTAEWINDLVKARQAAEAERDEARADADSLGDALVREVETVARVKEVIAGWWPVNLPDFGSADARDEIRAALADAASPSGLDDDAPTEVQQADEGPHSRACGIRRHEHGPDCHANCPTCGDESEAGR